MEIDNIYNMDCLEGMKQIPDGTIDAVICDLPYGTTACAWDSVIPFDKLWEQYNRIVKPNGAFVLFGAEPFSSALRMSNIENFKYDWIWRKPKGTGHLNAEKQPLRDVEIISVFYRKQCTYNPQMVKCLPHQRNHSRGKQQGEQTNRCYGQLNKPEDIISDEKYPRSIIVSSKKISTDGKLHPTQKPVDLCRWLIRTYSSENDIILDNCAGSGSTLVACIKERRHFIGFELNKEYFDKAMKRIKAEQAQLTLF